MVPSPPPRNTGGQQDTLYVGRYAARNANLPEWRAYVSGSDFRCTPDNRCQGATVVNVSHASIMFLFLEYKGNADPIFPRLTT